MAGILRPISENYITTHLEITCLSVVLDCNLVDSLMIGFVLIFWYYQWNWGMKCAGMKGSMTSVARDQFCWELEFFGGESINGIRGKLSMAVKYLVLLLEGSSMLLVLLIVIVYSLVLWYFSWWRLD